MADRTIGVWFGNSKVKVRNVPPRHSYQFLKDRIEKIPQLAAITRVPYKLTYLDKQKEKAVMYEDADIDELFSTNESHCVTIEIIENKHTSSHSQKNSANKSKKNRNNNTNSSTSLSSPPAKPTFMIGTSATKNCVTGHLFQYFQPDFYPRKVLIFRIHSTDLAIAALKGFDIIKANLIPKTFLTSLVVCFY